jgi:hypothetical protein
MYYVGFSDDVTENLEPREEGVVRAALNIAGWILEPLDG